MAGRIIGPKIVIFSPNLDPLKRRGLYGNPTPGERVRDKDREEEKLDR